MENIFLKMRNDEITRGYREQEHCVQWNICYMDVILSNKIDETANEANEANQYMLIVLSMLANHYG